MEVAQAIRRQAAALTFGVLQQSLRLSDPENDGVALGQWARQAPITAGSVEHAAAFMKAKELPQTVYFSGSALWWKEPTPNAYIVRVEKVSPPLVHKTVDSIQAKCNAGYERVGLRSRTFSRAFGLRNRFVRARAHAAGDDSHVAFTRTHRNPCA